MDRNIIEKLQSEAREAAKFSYSPYSKFRVGAALLTSDGRIYRGANIENRSYGLAICAERSAIFAAVSNGESTFQAMAIYTPDAKELLTPCGACRQVISEFAPPELPVFCSDGKGGFEEIPVSGLLPHDSLHDLSAG
ncbi:cytidine deaminase [Salinispira pacifica]